MSYLPRLPHDQETEMSISAVNLLLQNIDQQNPSRNFLWTSDCDKQLPVRIKKQGQGSQKPITICQMFQETVQNYGDKVALNFLNHKEEWITIDFKKYFQLCNTFAQSLITLQIPERSRINIIGFNSSQWAISFFGSILGNYIPVGLYYTNGSDMCQSAAVHSDCEIVILQDLEQLSKYLVVGEYLRKIKYYVLCKGSVPKKLPNWIKLKVITWNSFMSIGQKQYSPQQKKDFIDYRMASQNPGSCCTFIYTSGTTGVPKAAMLSHDNFTWVASAVGKKFCLDEQKGKGRILSFLPLSHVASQLCDLIAPLKFAHGVFYPDKSVLRTSLIRYLKVTKPTFFLSVPRIWERIEEQLMLKMKNHKGKFYERLFKQALQSGSKITHSEAQGLSLSLSQHWSRRLVFDKIKEALGLQHVKVYMFGAAPIKESTRLFFLKMNILLHNAYGMSETSGPHCFTEPTSWSSFSTKQFLRESGKCLPGCDVVIRNPNQYGIGEICMRGRNIFMGYFKDESETKNTLDDKGFIHSGDMGSIDSNNNLSITGRIKELIITAGGENIAPLYIEQQIQSQIPVFSHVVVVGDKRKYLGVLFALKAQENNVLDKEVVEYLEKRGSKARSVSEATKCPIVHKAFTEQLSKINDQTISQAFRVQKFIILPEALSIHKGTLTPSLKIKRKAVYELYKQYIEKLYTNPRL